MLNSTSSSGRRLAAAVFLGATSAAVAAASAHADGGVTGAKLGDTQYAGVVHMTDKAQDTKLYSLIPPHSDVPLWTYCIQEGVGQTSTTYSEGDWNSKTVGISTDNLKAIKWLVNNSFPTVDETTLAKSAKIGDGLTKQEAVAATQAAIWSFSGSNKLDEDAENKADANITALYDYLRAQVSGNLGDQPPASLGLTPLAPGVVHHGGDKVGFKILSSNTSESFVSFHLAADNTVGAKLVDADGKDIPAGTSFKSGSTIYVQLPPSLTKDGAVTLIADGTPTTIEAGRVFLPDTGTSQNLVLAQQTKAPVSATVTVTWAGTVVTPPTSSSSGSHSSPPPSSPSSHPTTPSSTTTTHSPAAVAAVTTRSTTTTPAATTTTTSDTDLAHTGAGNTMALGGGALALVAVGGGMVVYTRRRKQETGTHA